MESDYLNYAMSPEFARSVKCGKDLALTGISGILYVILQNFLALRMRLENNFIGIQLHAITWVHYV